MKRLIWFILILVVFYSCGHYKSITLVPADKKVVEIKDTTKPNGPKVVHLYDHHEVIINYVDIAEFKHDYLKNKTDRSVFVHGSDNVYKAEMILEHDSLISLRKFEHINSIHIYNELTEPSTKNRNKDNIHLFSDTRIDTTRTAHFSFKDVDSILMYVPSSFSRPHYDMDTSPDTGVLLVVIGVLLGITLIFVAIGAAIDGATSVAKDVTKGGCYIATMTYGSYDAPEVLTLRQFRDEILAKNLLGRIGIRIYYALSPAFVRWAENKPLINKWIRKRLDRFVTHLRTKHKW